MIFQALEYKGKHFLELNNDDNIPVKPTYSKSGAWLNLIRFNIINLFNFNHCYNLSLELRLYLGKDLRVGKKNISIGKA